MPRFLGFDHLDWSVRALSIEQEMRFPGAVAEVKSSTSAKSYHRADLATRLWVARAGGVCLRRAAVRHVDNRFVLTCAGDCDGLLVEAAPTDDRAGEIAAMPALIAGLRATLAGPEPDDVPGTVL